MSSPIGVASLTASATGTLPLILDLVNLAWPAGSADGVASFLELVLTA